MEDFFKDDEFAQFIINDYFVDSDMTDVEKLEFVSTSLESFNDAIECFKVTIGRVKSN